MLLFNMQLDAMIQKDDSTAKPNFVISSKRGVAAPVAGTVSRAGSILLHKSNNF